MSKKIAESYQRKLRSETGYVVRREGREERGAQVFIVWTLRCQ